MKNYYVCGAQNTAYGVYSHAEGYANARPDGYASSHAEGAYSNAQIQNFEDMVNALQRVGTTTDAVANSIKNLQYLYSQLGTASSVKTENPNQKSDLEISDQIVISEEFANLIDLNKKI